jgi:hypothetical protein
MRTFEVIAAIVIGLVLLVALKLIGLVLKFALIGALLGMVAGFFIARGFRKPT